jgi:hypothetical protein
LGVGLKTRARLRPSRFPEPLSRRLVIARGSGRIGGRGEYGARTEIELPDESFGLVLELGKMLLERVAP